MVEDFKINGQYILQPSKINKKINTDKQKMQTIPKKKLRRNEGAEKQKMNNLTE